MTTPARPQAAAPRTSRTPAQWYLLASGALVALWGLAGFFVNRSFAVGTRALRDPANHDTLCGVFVTNGWHDAVALAIGTVALVLSGTPNAWMHAAGLGAGYLAVTVTLAATEPFLLADNLTNNLVHLLLALGGLGTAAVSRPRRAAAPAT
ncbi:DUF4383 domain-containing protein [Streptomyces sp. B1866]|uniref:DUF4383 domain-containing protein n=1 Tax=Streptomyces sp. B1866 TaxID=3075431 RepID=UPI00288C7257|nr:DUF4383 domain-containing protein [Streptomyces sp. B1866]MDT3395883.1 DUF4383 domain-containing protein [Streptomyces sp. B1866]